MGCTCGKTDKNTPQPEKTITGKGAVGSNI
jgi:hypothetical protein